jgi:hypothetical protein
MPIPPDNPQFNSEDEHEEQPEHVVGEQELPPGNELPPVADPQTGATEPSVPPIAVYETNGGPLGCCLGAVVGILISLLLGLIGFGHVTANVIVFLIHVDAATNIRVATAFFSLLGAALGGYVGWKVGKRLYREYEPPVIKDRRSKPRATPKEAK